MSLVVRPATPEDAPAIVALTREVAAEARFIARLPEEVRGVEEEAEGIRRADPATRLLLVAERDGALAGFLGLRRGERAANRHTADVGLHVAPAHRRKGVGRALMQAAETWARAQGVEKLGLGVFHDNGPALALYRALGYEVEGRRRGQWRIGVTERDEVVMAKWLR